MACHGNDGSMVSSCCIEGIYRICKEYLVQNCHAFYIAGFHAKYNKRTISKLFWFYCQFLSITYNCVKGLTLWEKGIFTGFYGFQCIQICLFFLIPETEICLSCLFNRKDQILAFCDFPE